MKKDDDEYQYILGAEGLNMIKPGDLVQWTELGPGQKTGLVRKTYIRQVGGRDVAYAEVLTGDATSRTAIVEEKLIASLRIISNRKE